MISKLNRDAIIKSIILSSVIKIKKSKNIFWNFCKTLHNYKEDWLYLKDLCNKLQLFYENKLLDENGKAYTKLMINMPPRHYKTRTLILFCCWILGKDNDNKIISTSYSDDLATEFSRYTRDEISRDKNNDYDVNYSDIFPDTKIKYGDASYSKWALEGKHFTYLGAGFGASITGKGCDIGIIDDQIKNYEEALNENLLEKKWDWYTGTFLSRLEEGAKQIIVMTRWSDNDICGRILSNDEESKEWYKIIYEAYNQETGLMLCDEMLSKESYEQKRKLMADDVFNANYHQITINKKGSLYQNYKLYDKLPMIEDVVVFDRRMCYIDVADEGDDYLCAICGIDYHKDFYMQDVVYSKEPNEVTEIQVCEMLIRNEIKDVLVESNSGGRAFARNIERILREKYKVFNIQVRWFHQGLNKISRIISNSSNVENRFYYPLNWSVKFPVFSKDVKGFMRSKKNKNDDGPDTITGIIEMLDNKQIISIPKVSAGRLGL